MNIAVTSPGSAAVKTERLPAFTDEKTCRQWLAALPLTNVALVQTRLNSQLGFLNRCSLGTGERLKILELLRDPIEFVQQQSLPHFAGRPLPFNAHEQAAFDSSQTLWQELVAGYLQCLRALIEGPAAGEHSPHLAASLAATRALAAMSAIYLNACRANFLIAPMFWRQVHAIFRAAEELKVTQLPVDDRPRRKAKTTATSVYVEMLLLAASSPVELRPWQLSLVADWAQRWSGKVAILRQAPSDDRAPPLCVDLDSDQAATFQNQLAQGDARRWLEISDLRRSIRKRLVLLARGESPETLELGIGCEQPACEALLKRIYRRWCRGGLKEDIREPVRRVKASCHLVSGFDAIRYSLIGQTSSQQAHSAQLNTREHEEIAAYGRVTGHFDNINTEMPGSIPEEWRIVDQDAANLQLERHLVPSGMSLVGEQLVAVRMQNSEVFTLGRVSWIAMSASRDGLIARIKLLPGQPEEMTLRCLDADTGDARYISGLYLPDVDRLGEVATLIVPTGWFVANQPVSVELPKHGTRTARLDRLIELGADYARITLRPL